MSSFFSLPDQPERHVAGQSAPGSCDLHIATRGSHWNCGSQESIGDDREPIWRPLIVTLVVPLNPCPRIPPLWPTLPAGTTNATNGSSSEFRLNTVPSLKPPPK